MAVCAVALTRWLAGAGAKDDGAALDVRRIRRRKRAGCHQQLGELDRRDRRPASRQSCGSDVERTLVDDDLRVPVVELAAIAVPLRRRRIIPVVAVVPTVAAISTAAGLRRGAAVAEGVALRARKTIARPIGLRRVIHVWACRTNRRPCTDDRASRNARCASPKAIAIAVAAGEVETGAEPMAVSVANRCG
jgi:hypothetical protein